MKASIALAWKRPHRAAEAIPARHLSPQSSPRAVRADDALPAGRPQRRLRARHGDLEGVGPGDDRRGDRDGRLRRRAARRAGRHSPARAGPVGPATSARRRRPEPTANQRSDREAKLREFCRKFAERAFRRPLTADEQAGLHRPPVQLGRNARSGRQARRAAGAQVAAVPVSRDRRATAQPTPTTSPSRLSFGLWDSLPDDELLEGRRRRASSPRASRSPRRPSGCWPTRGRASKLREFFLQWLKVDQVPDLAKDPEQFPDFDAAVASDLRTSLELFLDDVVWSETSDFRQLLAGRLAAT